MNAARSVRLTMSAFPPACSMAKYFLDSTLPVRRLFCDNMTECQWHKGGKNVFGTIVV